MLCEARRLLALVVFLSLGLTGCYDPPQTKAQTPPQDGYPVCITTAHGTSCIESPPKRVVTLGAGAEDWTLSLGVVPIAIEPHYWGGDAEGYLPWFRQALEAQELPLPAIISSYPELDVERLLALKPDLILAPQSGITRESFLQLSALAPVIAYPDKPWLTPVKQQVELIAKALGKEVLAEALLKQQQAYIAQVAAENPEFNGVRLAYINAASRVGNLSVYVTGDPRVDLLLALGFVLPPQLFGLNASRGHFAAHIGLERADMLDDAELLLSWYSSDKARAEVEAMAVIRRLPAMRRGRYLAITDPALVMASSYGSLLSLKWAIPKLVPQLQQTLAEQKENPRQYRHQDTQTDADTGAHSGADTGGQSNKNGRPG
ncbi:iron-siderophore ABC transporter substrate-binding protein [Shewanella algae]|uniref:iron-siderophore ABC transporter substrate-binding protein n=1 Tax=Shewanella algae TaxID=38313 RepID=UPI001AAD7E6C|nr:iron-siderophore ABC transporter substrate-binding protein [Shewanella algae]MBO2569067.1 iron-siderophore ABC transporter substrate-binding protein [Shewanella algae]